VRAEVAEMIVIAETTVAETMDEGTTAAGPEAFVMLGMMVGGGTIFETIEGTTADVTTTATRAAQWRLSAPVE